MTSSEQDLVSIISPNLDAFINPVDKFIHFSSQKQRHSYAVAAVATGQVRKSSTMNKQRVSLEEERKNEGELNCQSSSRDEEILEEKQRRGSYDEGEEENADDDDDVDDDDNEEGSEEEVDNERATFGDDDSDDEDDETEASSSSCTQATAEEKCSNFLSESSKTAMTTTTTTSEDAAATKGDLNQSSVFKSSFFHRSGLDKSVAGGDNPRFSFRVKT